MQLFGYQCEQRFRTPSCRGFAFLKAYREEYANTLWVEIGSMELYQPLDYRMRAFVKISILAECFTGFIHAFEYADMGEIFRALGLPAETTYRVELHAISDTLVFTSTAEPPYISEAACASGR